MILSIYMLISTLLNTWPAVDIPGSFSVQPFCLCYSALRVSLDSQLHTLNSRNPLSSSSVPYPASWPRTTIEAVIWDNHKVSLTCLPSLVCCLIFSVLKIVLYILSTFSLGGCFRWSLLYHLNCKERSATKFTMENCLRVKWSKSGTRPWFHLYPSI